jgi:hypothetical protein
MDLSSNTSSLPMPAPGSEAIHFSDGDHWRFGWGDGLYNFHEREKTPWCTFGPCRYEPKTFDIELAAAAHRVADTAAKPLYVAMSGGLDSELVARIMVQEKIPFTPLIGQYLNDYNKQDIAFAFEFCKLHNLTPEVVKIDILALFRDSIHTPYPISNIAHLLQMHLMRHAASKGGMAIISTGEHRYEQKDGKFVLPFHTDGMGVLHFMKAENVHGVYHFFRYTPEMMLSILRESKAFGFDKMGFLAHNIKESLYHTYWPDMPVRPKYSGFENISQQRAKAQVKLLVKYGSMIQQVYIPVDELELQLAKNLPPSSAGSP